MKKTLRKLTFITAALLMGQMSFGQLVVVPLTADTAASGEAHYASQRNDPEYNRNDNFAYNPDSPTNPWPDTNASHSDNYYLPKETAADNWWSCDLVIPANTTIKYMDFYGRNYNGTNSGIFDRFTNLKITLSDGVSPDETHTWVGIPESIYNDGIDDNNHARMDFEAQGFSATMLQNATSIRIDQASDGANTFLEFMEIRLAGTSTLSTNNLKANKLIVSPNPLQAGNQLKISLTNISNDSNKLVQVYSVIGKEIYKTNMGGSDVSIDYNVFPSAGLYLVKIGSFVSKVIIK
ncbi:T9SS type A sorting domain-containing protein [Flavivirga algicola]|uniref:T9SS type A sorting domain-containing protein n=1 Tax=Flavivirga algicola TaxID=2729136 RepID=A0ABX1S1T4_9FLAO|nr:T9SS type A sorting domain-containing protein [Flavivirga algicola]NMH89851.1 T9SS type A sorting domain-containing protein [Flavivirga algicola]